MEDMFEALQDELSGFGVEIDLEDETVEIYLKTPSGELYNDIVDAIEELVEDHGFSLDGDFEGHLSVF